MKIIRRKDGKEIRLLNMREKAEKFANELKSGIKITIDGEPKYDDYGNIMSLSEKDRGIRSGFLMAYNENCKMFNKKKNKKEW